MSLFSFMFKCFKRVVETITLRYKCYVTPSSPLCYNLVNYRLVLPLSAAAELTFPSESHPKDDDTKNLAQEVIYLLTCE